MENAEYLAARLDSLEKRMEALESAASPDGSDRAPGDTDEGLWIIDGLRETLAGDGGVAFGGAVTTGAGVAHYQWTRTTPTLTEHAWDDQLERVAAVAHPTRGAILRRLLQGPASVAELVEAGLVSSSGTAYHHVAALSAAGWISKGPGGRLGIPVGRVVPLLTLVTCGEDH